MGILELNSLEKLVFSLLGSDCESSSTMLMLLVLPCLLGLVVEVCGQDYPPTHPPPTPSAYVPHHQPGYAPAGYVPAQGYGGSGDLMKDPYLLSLLLGGDSGFGDDNLMLMASMMGNKYGGYGGYGGGMMNNPMMMMHLMRNGGLSSDPLTMMAMMGGGKKMNPLLMTTLLQCKEENLRCVQPNNLRYEECGLQEDEDDEYTNSGRKLLPCCTCEKTAETILEGVE